MKIALTIALLWLLCAFVAAGGIFADFEGEFPSKGNFYKYRDHLGLAWGWSLAGGPLAFLLSIFLTGFWRYGWRLK